MVLFYPVIISNLYDPYDVSVSLVGIGKTLLKYCVQSESLQWRRENLDQNYVSNQSQGSWVDYWNKTK